MSIGLWEASIILLTILVIFGAGKLPTVMGDIAKGIRNFKQEMKAPSEAGATPPAPRE